MKLTGAQAIWESLLREGVEVVFGYPGGSTLPTYDALVDYPGIHHVLVRHEANAIFAADGFARATGRVGVCLATSGPGATNLITGLANAMADSIPVVALVGQVLSGLVGGDAFQEIDITGVSLPITKHNYLVTRADQVASTIKEAFHVARTGRPGPVLIDICKDAQFGSAEFVYPESVKLPGYRPRQKGVPQLVTAAAGLINNARQPVILAGHGVAIADAFDELRQLAESGDIPVVTTLLGIGTLPQSHALNLGMAGMHGHSWANEAVQNADLLIALGMRFDDRFTGSLKHFAPNAEVIHVDIDPAEIGKNVPVEVGIEGDVRSVLRQLLPQVASGDRSPWRRQIAAWREDSESRDILNSGEFAGLLLAPQVIHEIWRETGGDALVVTDVGQHQMWAAQYFPCEHRGQLITSGGLGSMGFSLGAAMGAKMGCPDKEVWVIVGDGGFQMCSMELATLVQEGVNLKIAVMRNGYLGMVRQWQEMMHNRRYSAITITSPDLGKLADAYGVLGLGTCRPDEVSGTIRRARQHPGPVLIDFQVEPEGNVFPMVQPGKALNEMVRRPRPDMAFAAK
jgi:acetolactate synthase I/II/III large subunit